MVAFLFALNKALKGLNIGQSAVLLINGCFFVCPEQGVKRFKYWTICSPNKAEATGDREHLKSLA